MAGIPIVDDRQLARQYFLNLFSASAEHTASAVVNGEEALDYCRSQPVDLILMDVMLPGMNGPETARRIRSEHPRTRLVLVSEEPEVSFPELARQIGADGFWYTEQTEPTITEVVEAVLSGRRYFPDSAPERMLGNILSGSLTPKELEVLRVLTTGAGDREIAERLGISPTTVRYHIKNLLQKTGFRCRTQLAVRARTVGIVIGDL